MHVLSILQGESNLVCYDSVWCNCPKFFKCEEVQIAWNGTSYQGKLAITVYVYYDYFIQLVLDLRRYSILHKHLIFHCAEMHRKSLYSSDDSAISCYFSGSIQVWCYKWIYDDKLLGKCIMHLDGIMTFAIIPQWCVCKMAHKCSCKLQAPTSGYRHRAR